MTNHTTASQRYNKRLDAIFENAKILNAKYAPLHALVDALNRIDKFASITTQDNLQEAKQQEKDYTLILNFIHKRF